MTGGSSVVQTIALVPARSTLKHLSERVLLSTGVAGLFRNLHRGGVLILAYHNIVPEGVRTSGDRSLHLSRAAFAAQLEALVTTHRVVGLGDLLVESSRPMDRPRAVITFDDAYHGAVTAGVEEVVARALPATIFVAPGFIGSDSFWWDDLVWPEEQRTASSLRDRLLRELQGDDPSIRVWARREGIQLREPEQARAPAGAEDLERAIRQPGISLGSHTWSHRNLAELPASDYEGELVRPLRWLMEKFPQGSVIPWLTYPYGLFSAAAASAVRESGYEGAMKIDGGWAGELVEDGYRLPRLNIPADLSTEGFRLRTAGLLCR